MQETTTNRFFLLKKNKTVFVFTLARSMLNTFNLTGKFLELVRCSRILSEALGLCIGGEFSGVS